MARRKLPELMIEVVEITPELAKEWLNKNTYNRKKSERLIDIYAEAMLNDEWRLNGETIIFDKNDRLQSGQHRLEACIRADVPFWSLVVWGAEPEALFTLDTGRRRRMTDLLTLRGEKDVAVLGSMLSWIWRWEHQAMDERSVLPSNIALLKLLDARPEIRDFLAVAYRFRKALKVPSGLMCALFYEFHLISADEAEHFLDQCITGENLSSGEPAFAWRRWIQARMLETSRPNQPTIAAITIKAWNAYRNHEPVRVLRWAGNEIFPEVV